ncbi:MAG: VIT domain-containing protein [Planctomycetota bacterium]|jgi:hypothetical protein
MTDRSKNPSDPRAPSGGPPPRDELDALLRSWHAVNAERATAGRDRLLAGLRAETRPREAPRPAGPALGESVVAFISLLRSVLMNRYSPVAASLLLLVTLIAVLMPGPRGQVFAQPSIMVPEGGRLDALDDEGNILGPCPLKHTDVDVQISGFLSRVTLTQTYHNRYEKKIEAVYTFPMSHRAAVDRMTMTIGDRVVVGEVKERELARRIYEAARAQGYVASLLEQERPNIFTQSVANIEQGAEVIVEISYVEVLQPKDGTYRFDFPMVVGPRYIPGAPTASPSIAPAELTTRQGLVLLGPARLTVGAAGEVSKLGTLQTGKLQALLYAARPIRYPGDVWWGRGDETGGAGQPVLWYRFEAVYTDAAKEFGELYTDGTGQLNGRWFFADPKMTKGMGTGFGQDTSQVPDASRITPEPVKPGERAGHDISIAVTIDTGGPGLLDITSQLHAIDRRDEVLRDDRLPRRVTLALKEKNEIPNRDFVLAWRQTAETIQEATFAHTSDKYGDYAAGVGGFFTLILQPPDRVDDADVPPRELIFVMDSSGSMRGFPIDKSKAVMTRAIDAMRESDTFNVITFAGHTAILWDKPRPATKPNRAEARSFVESRRGGGGTEMMKAINAALVQAAGAGPGALAPRQLVDLPADGRAVEVTVEYKRIHVTEQSNTYRIPVGEDLSVLLEVKTDLPTVFQPEGVTVRLSGRWQTRAGRRVLVVDRSWLDEQPPPAKPLRIVLFFTDGYVGNDMAIIDAIRTNAGTTRVFCFGIGNSVNRYLIDGMARAGRGEAEFVLLESDADEAVERFTRRVETPVLTDIALDFSEGLEVVDLLPTPDAVPDLFDAKPLVIHGRYATPGKGTLTIKGRTGAGPYERTIELDLPAHETEHDVIATVWARARVEDLLTPHLKAVQQGAAPDAVRQQVIALGEVFQIMTQYTSFVAVEKSRMTIGGQPVLVAVPIEMPQGVSYEGVFGEVAESEEEAVVVGTRLQMLRQAAMEGKAPGLLEARGEIAGTIALGRGREGGVGGGRGAPGPARRRFLDGRPSPQSAPGAAMQAPQERLSRLYGATGMKSAAPEAAPPTNGGKGGPRRGGGVIFGDPGEEPVGDQNEAGRDMTLLVVGDREADARADALSLAQDKKTLDELKDVMAGITAERRKAGERDEERDAFFEDTAGLRRAGLDAIPLIGEVFNQPARPVPHLAGRPLFAEHVAMAIAAFVERGELDDARTLAEALAASRPDYQIATRMRDALADESQGEAERAQTIGGLAAQAEAQIKAVFAEARRQARLRRVLDPVLLALLEKPDASAAEGVTYRDGRVLVTVLVTAVDDATSEALAGSGLDIEAAAKSLPIVVGAAGVSDLERIALVDGVRRIEPTRMD